MRIKWLGHSAFLLTAADGTRIITDPYVPGSFSGQLRYGPIRETAHAVTVSHHHRDHDGVQQLPGEPAVFDRAGTYKEGSVSISGVDTFHDESKGAERGHNVVFVFEEPAAEARDTIPNAGHLGHVPASLLRVCHCGDLGHVLSAHQVTAIGKVDVLLLPVGGTFTVDATAAHEVADQLAARVVIPMHYRTAKLEFDIDGIEVFTQGGKNVKQIGHAEVEVAADKLPQTQEVWVLEHAL
jgi:L-ascorbate metabolism protein UlaG (beta-lactamase superfamily)